MTNEMKLMRAFIDAMGYEVEEVDINPRKHDRYPSEPIIDYKVTKRPFDIKSEKCRTCGACVLICPACELRCHGPDPPTTLCSGCLNFSQ